MSARMIDWSKCKWPEGYAKPILVVADNMVGAFREAYPFATIIPVSETYLPSPVSEGERG